MGIYNPACAGPLTAYAWRRASLRCLRRQCGGRDWRDLSQEMCRAVSGVKMKLYTYYRSSASYRVRIALNMKNLACELVPVHLAQGRQHDPEFLAINPQGLVPALVTESGHVISQSLAIIDYLDEISPKPALLPGDPESRALARAMAALVACDIHPLNNLRVLKYLKGTLGQDQTAVDQWYSHWVSEGFAALETLVSQHGSDKACFGDKPTVADICLVPQMWNARRFNVDLSPFPNLVRIDAHLCGLEAFADAAPEVQPDAT